MKRRKGGFSMIEVLVSLVIICIGVLGMVALQTRSVALSQDSVQRSNAMVLANELLELMRSNRDQVMASDKVKIDGAYIKQPGTNFRTKALDAGKTCLTRDRSAGGETVAGQDLGCWLNQAKALLPVTDALIASSFAVCPASKVPLLPASPTDPGIPLTVCENTARATVMVVIAWQDVSNDQLNCPAGICYYALRSEL
ncbi:type IV pilus modification protein PilV [Pseudomonas oryzihabitans]|jgi:type IV pilus assembly protein PilV|uniref:type IV pilus modification protein PilV n=1 Tax=Pseudomonas oryzihabitans TaxID=47885 RepID=UPI002557547E|nr:type IV pilus modification protein PilV [Pseudomonas oryzihabitans]MDK8263869.1 type IV pilus modification protein PilV [Pseudomonas oryzihabitans]